MKIFRPPSQQPMPLTARKVFSGKIFNVYQWKQKLFDGSTTTFEKLKRADTVLVIPVLSSGEILLIEQEQPGKKSFLGVPDGRVDPGEDVENAARRELREETGYQATEFFLWDARQPISKIDYAVYTFIAKGCKKVTNIELDAGEKIVAKPVSIDEFFDLALAENFADVEIAIKIARAVRTDSGRDKLHKLF